MNRNYKLLCTVTCNESLCSVLITNIRKRQWISESEEFSIQHTCAHYDRLCFIIYGVRGTGGGDKHVEKKRITLKFKQGVQCINLDVLNKLLQRYEALCLPTYKT